MLHCFGSRFGLGIDLRSNGVCREGFHQRRISGWASVSFRTNLRSGIQDTNTAHKVIQHLIQERWLEVRSGIGTVVAEIPEPRSGDRKRLLQNEVGQLVVEAKRVELDIDDRFNSPPGRVVDEYGSLGSVSV